MSKKLTAKEFRDFENDFFKKHEEYREEVRKLFRNSDISEEEIEERLARLKEKYKGYVDVFEPDSYTSVNDEYLEVYDGGDVNAQQLCEEAKKYIGTRVIYSDDENCIGTLEDIVAMVDDYYYVIKRSDAAIRYCSCVGGIELYNK
jgi:hypothetical protein